MNKKIVVIVLGNRLNDDGTITKIQKERLEYARELETIFKPSYFILSGGLANKVANKTEAQAMYEYLLSSNIDKNKLILEDKSLSTVQNAKNSIPIAIKLGAEIIIVCTSGYHFADAQYKAMESFVNELKDTNIALMTYSK